MRRFILKLIARLRGFFTRNRPKVDVDALIQENLELMKEIRMHRIKIYKLSKKI